MDIRDVLMKLEEDIHKGMHKNLLSKEQCSLYVDSALKIEPNKNRRQKLFEDLFLVLIGGISGRDDDILEFVDRTGIGNVPELKELGAYDYSLSVLLYSIISILKGEYQGGKRIIEKMFSIDLSHDAGLNRSGPYASFIKIEISSILKDCGIVLEFINGILTDDDDRLEKVILSAKKNMYDAAPLEMMNYLLSFLSSFLYGFVDNLYRAVLKDLRV